jgi:hypothetical protein
MNWEKATKKTIAGATMFGAMLLIAPIATYAVVVEEENVPHWLEDGLEAMFEGVETVLDWAQTTAPEPELQAK